MTLATAPMRDCSMSSDLDTLYRVSIQPDTNTVEVSCIGIDRLTTNWKALTFLLKTCLSGYRAGSHC